MHRFRHPLLPREEGITELLGLFGKLRGNVVQFGGVATQVIKFPGSTVIRPVKRLVLFHGFPNSAADGEIVGRLWVVRTGLAFVGT